MPEREVIEGLADKLKELREAAGLSQLEAAERSGIHHISINRFEKDKRVPTLSNLYKLAEAYGVNICKLLPGGQLESDEDKKPEKKPAAKKGKGKK
jgi:transcriptional regulator with XRE-family HTH domain